MTRPFFLQRHTLRDWSACHQNRSHPLFFNQPFRDTQVDRLQKLLIGIQILDADQNIWLLVATVVTEYPGDPSLLLSLRDIRMFDAHPGEDCILVESLREQRGNLETAPTSPEGRQWKSEESSIPSLELDGIPLL